MCIGLAHARQLLKLSMLQIPFFMRQTDLLIAAGETGKTINIKKGQFLSPEKMEHAVEK